MKYTIYIAAAHARRVQIRLERCTCGNASEIVCVLTPEGIPFLLDDRGGDGARQSAVELRFLDEAGGCTFFPRDVRGGVPILSSRLGIAVSGENTVHDYGAILARVTAAGAKTRVRRAEEGPEPAWKGARRLPWHRCPTFLAVPGNVHLYEVGFRGFPIEEKQHMELYDYVIPRQNWDRVTLDAQAERVVYRYLLGRGMGCKTRLRRSLCEGIFPILRATLQDGGIGYETEYFADVPAGEPEEDGGTDYRLADLHSAAHMLTEEQREAARRLPVPSLEQTPVLRMRIRMKNHSQVSKYAFLRLPQINTPVMAESNALPQTFQNGKGFYRDRVYMIARADGRGVESLETAYCLSPGAVKTVELVLFFYPVEEAFAETTFAPFAERKARILALWRKKLGSLAGWSLPEKRIERALKAGFLQLQASCFGAREAAVVAPCIGVYSPIATESIAVVACLSSFGAQEFAKKCTNYFFAKQRDDGFIQNMVGYMAETGGALYLAGRIYRETRDLCWLQGHRENIRAAVGCLRRWTERNQDERGGGRGMIDGQVADPQDTYRSYSLNALAYAGLSEAAHLLGALSDPSAGETAALAAALGENIRSAFGESLIRGVLVPLENGEWAPLTAPWAEGKTGCCLHREGEIAVTHASAVLKDSLTAASILFVLGVLPAQGSIADEFICVQTDLFADRLTDLSQPYYNVIPYLNLFRGERNCFLQEYYTAFATMADRETYAFWEHYFLATPHKTSEQAAFLLRTRMMLYYERDGRLYLLSGIPAAWTAEGRHIRVEKAVCAYGTFTLDVSFESGRWAVQMDCHWQEDAAVCTVWRLPGREPTEMFLSTGTHQFALKEESNEISAPAF